MHFLDSALKNQKNELENAITAKDRSMCEDNQWLIKM